jgi:hypothetical protein
MGGACTPYPSIPIACDDITTSEGQLLMCYGRFQHDRGTGPKFLTRQDHPARQRIQNMFPYNGKQFPFLYQLSPAPPHFFAFAQTGSVPLLIQMTRHLELTGWPISAYSRAQNRVPYYGKRFWGTGQPERGRFRRLHRNFGRDFRAARPEKAKKRNQGVQQAIFT